ncbi:MAG: hypothetical protein F4X26_08370 [Chloroflexi bacterium]|nr:hypothetical protein [Chloroflexota bacterium]
MTHVFRRHSTAAALLLALLAFALTGCIRVQLTFTVHEDGSGVVGMLMAVDEDLLGLTGESAEDVLGEGADLPEGATTEAYEADGFVGQLVTVPVPDMTRLNESLGDAEAVTASAEDFRFVREEDVWRFTTTVPAGEELTGEGGDMDLAGLLGEDAYFRVRVALPGEVTEHNADRVEDGLLVWEIDWTSSEPRMLSAVSRPGSGGGTDTGFVVVLAGVAALAALAAFAWRSRPSPA